MNPLVPPSPNGESVPGSPGVLRGAGRELVRLPAVLACALVDAGSGMVLDAHVTGRTPGGVDGLADVAAAQLELVRTAEDLRAGAPWAGHPAEIVVAHGPGLFHLVRPVADPYGDGLVLAVLVAAPERNLRRVRRKLDKIEPASLVPGRPVAAPRETPPAPAPPGNPWRRRPAGRWSAARDPSAGKLRSFGSRGRAP
ncbi:hypothetical protein [Pseudonocardia sp. T1-2H]|uniref:hypothetical protein n=1 Tax=Pseudonocardia sp. T1-2H TaxID=3128899 RepID=UPI003100BDBB